MAPMAERLQMRKEEILPFLNGDINNFAYIFAPESLSGQDESVKNRSNHIFVQIGH